MTALEEIRSKREEILALGVKYGIKDIRVFGSVARGEERPDSDVDLLVNIDKDNYKDGFDFFRFKDDTEVLLHRKVDLVSEKGLYHMLKDIVLSEAKPL
jgi:predicted nucleotidyltransferase